MEHWKIVFNKVTKKDLFWLCILLFNEYSSECPDQESAVDAISEYKEGLTNLLKNKEKR